MKNKIIGWLTTIIMVGALVAPLVWAEVGNVEQGQKVYEMYCVMCHGSAGQGDGPLAIDLNPPPAALTREEVRKYTDEKLLTIIQKGSPGTSMPGWESDLSKQDIQNVFVFVRSLQS